MTAIPQWQSSVDSSRCVPLVAVKNGREIREAGSLDWPSQEMDSGWMHDAQPQHTTPRVSSLRASGRIDPNRLGGFCWANWSRISGCSRLRHTPDSRSLTLPLTSSSCTIPLILHESWTSRPGLPILRLIRPLTAIRRRRGVDVVVSCSGSQFVGDPGHSGSSRGLSRLASRDDADRKWRSEQLLLPSRNCYWASCYRGLHERPMKMKVVQRVGEGLRSRPNESSGVYVPHPSAAYDKGVGRTRP